MTQPTAKRSDLFVGLGLSVSALLVAFTGGLITPVGWLTPTQSASVFPAICLLGLAVCGLVIARGQAANSSQGLAATAGLRVIGMGLAMAIYAAALPVAGLIVSTVVLLAVLPLIFGYWNWRAILLFAAIVIGLTWLVFIALMGVPLKL